MNANKTWEVDVTVRLQVRAAHDVTQADLVNADISELEFSCPGAKVLGFLEVRDVFAREVEEEYVVLSPDGIPIDTHTYSCREDAVAALHEWCAGFERQGYYAGVRGRIALADLPAACEIRRGHA